MFVLMQLYPSLDDDLNYPDVIAIDASKVEIERYLVDYKSRYLAACDDFDSWDADKTEPWTAEHDRIFDEICDKYRVGGSLIKETREILYRGMSE